MAIRGVKCLIYFMLVFAFGATILSWIVITIPLALDMPYIMRNEYRSVEGVVVHDCRDSIVIVSSDNESEERRFGSRRNISVGTTVRINYLPNTELLVSVTRITRAPDE